MRSHGHLIALLAALCLTAAPANACVLVVVGGTLALQGDYTAVSSEGTLGATITVSTTILDGGFTVSITQPTLDLYPAGFPAGTAIVEQRTSSVVSTIDMNFPYTTGPISKSFSARLLSAAVITLHHRITANAYPQGNYRTKTVVTCS